MVGNEPETEFVAFISYSREDEALAKQLETEIEAYQRPGSAASARIFRDRSDFTGSAYESALDGHLRNSKCLIVLCSPQARRSRYVSDEIRMFAKHHGSERIFPVLVSGLPDNEADDKKAFPAALLEVMQGRGIPLGAEYRDFDLGTERVNGGRFEGEWYKLLANIYGVSVAEIRDEDTKRQVRTQRRRLLLTAAAAAVLLALVVVIFVLWRSAAASELRAIEAERKANEMAARSQTELGLREKAHEVPTSPSPAVPGEELPARVYVHVRNAQQKQLAQTWAPGLTEDLEAAGLRVVVPPIEVLKVGPTKSSELRFFRDSERADAERIARALRDKPGLSDLVVTKVPGYENSTKIRPRHFELWIGPN